MNIGAAAAFWRKRHGWMRFCLVLFLSVFFAPLYMYAQEDSPPAAPQPPVPPAPPAPPSASAEQSSIIEPEQSSIIEPEQPSIIEPNQGSAGESDPDFPMLELQEIPLETSGGVLRSRLLYRRFVFEVFSGYYGALMNLYTLDKNKGEKGNSRGNLRESDWENFFNILVGAQISGHVRRFHYDIWFALPFNLGLDYVRQREYEFAFTQERKTRDKDDASRLARFQSKLKYLFHGGLRMGSSLVNRKSAKLILGGGLEGMLGSWEMEGGSEQGRITATFYSATSKKYPNKKSLSLLAGQIMPFAYIQAGAFLLPMLEVSLSAGYSPLTIWFAEENHFYLREILGAPPLQQRRYGYFGQTILGGWQARLWLGRRFALKIGMRGRFTFKTVGTRREYKIDSAGKPLNEVDFVLGKDEGAMQYFQFSAFLGFGLAFDRKLPPGSEYAMPF